MGFQSALRGKKSTFSGTVQRTAHVMTSTSEVIFFGVLFRESNEWLRVATADIRIAESVAFLQPDTVVCIEVQGSIVQVDCTYHRLVRVKPERDPGLVQETPVK